MKIKGLTNNQLKLIAMTAMLLDHAGMLLFPQYKILRIIGRIAFPIFAYMIAEGCLHTRNRQKYLLGLFMPALIIQAVYIVAMNSLYQNILITFSLSAMLIFAIDGFVKKRDRITLTVMLAVTVAVAFVTLGLPILLEKQGFVIDYGFWGVILPVAVYFAPKKVWKLTATAVILVIRGIIFGELKWFAPLALPLLMLYNGERGKLKLKYLFYIFYPAHLVILYAISLFIK